MKEFFRDGRVQAALSLIVIALGCFLVMALGGCATALPKLPQKVMVTVREYKPLPAWAVAPLIKPEPADATVGARLKANDSRGVLIDYANCRSELLARLDRGETVMPEECK